MLNWVLTCLCTLLPTCKRNKTNGGRSAQQQEDLDSSGLNRQGKGKGQGDLSHFRSFLRDENWINPLFREEGRVGD